MSNTADRVEKIFWEAAHLAPGEERDAYLARACGPASELRGQVERLLRVQPKVEAFLEQPFAGPAPAAITEACEAPGTVLGAYELVEQIGEGGMGLVFMAEQLRPVRRKVALKVLKPGMDTRQVVARFEAERQALARMDHPHIARVFDAGTTPTGRPYFVMELVRGVPVTEFCDQRRLTTRQRLELFVGICQAVQHAHQKGIIHRDLKPTNVLVTLHDTVAVPKVIDFGIAKAVGHRLTEHSLFTQFAQMVGTPLYMSPEQAEMNALDVDTRSDVYSLGVLLYELLTGTTPFGGETLKRVGLDEVRRIIREDEPPRPSDRVNTLPADALTTVSERRDVDRRRLRQVLCGELDWVVMKALEKDRNRRYESASAFAADVLRYLNDEAVEACPPSAGYRLRKYARRNRRMLLTAGVFAGVLVTATVVSVWQAVQARQAQRQAEDAEGRAATEAAIARAVSDFLQNDLLGQVARAPQPGQGNRSGVYLTVKEAVDRAALRIGERFKDQPLVEAAIRTTIGVAYNDLHDYQSAVPQLERAVALRKEHLGPNHKETLRSMEKLAVACEWVGRHQDAVAIFQQIVADQTARLGPNHPVTLSSMNALARAHWSAGELDTSRQLLERVLEKQRVILGPAHDATFSTMWLLARTHHDEGQLADATALFERALEICKSGDGANLKGRRKANMLSLAQVYQDAGKLEQSERLLREVLELCRKDDNNPRARADTANALGFLARALLLQQKSDEAEPLVREAVAIFEEYQPHAVRRYYWTSLLGDVLLGQGKYAEAELFILNGYKGSKQLEHIYPAQGRRRVAETGERVVRFYEVTNQPEKARMWREKLHQPAPSE